jgi:hypothetical protein
MHVTGRCHCGEITYEADIDPDRVSICHCADCQRLTGTAYRVSAPAPRDSFHLAGGTAKSYVKYGDSGAKSTQFFCSNCGSPLYRIGADEEYVGIRLGTVDQRHELTPRMQIWRQSALPWARDIRSLPQYEGED